MAEQVSPLQEIREKLALPLGENAVFDGWTQAAVDAAAAQAGVDRDQARLAFPKDQAGKIDCGATCTATLDDGATTTLRARPARGFRFVRWGGACSGKALTCTVTVRGSQDVTATFKKKPRKKKPRP